MGREPEWDRLTEFANSGRPSTTLGIVWGGLRIGTSFLLHEMSEQVQGFYYPALRGSSVEALRDLGEHLGEHAGSVARIALGDRAAGAKLLLFGSSFDEAVQASAGERRDLEIVDLRRLYEGA